MQPYLLAFCEQKANGFARSVLTAVARIGPNKTLFATCSHVLTQMNSLLIVDENGAFLPEAKLVAVPVTKSNLDLVFLVICHDVPFDRIRINDAPISRGTEITHARNRFGKTETISPFVTHSAPAKKSSFWAELGWSDEDSNLRYGFLKDEGELQQAKREGVLIFYPILEMESWPGVSGSALWDKFGAIRGIVCGGDSPENRQKEGIPHLVYIPARTILKEVSHILKDKNFRSQMMRG